MEKIKPRILGLSTSRVRRARQMMKEDPLVENLAQIGSLDQEYFGLMALVENKTLPRDLPKYSELKQVEGCLQELRVVEMRNGDRLLCKDSAVYVPKGGRTSILKTLHLCHSAPGSMIANTKGRIYWLNISRSMRSTIAV